MSYEEAADYVEQILADVRDRAGLGDELDRIDEETQEEIREQWIKILMEG